MFFFSSVLLLWSLDWVRVFHFMVYDLVSECGNPAIRPIVSGFPRIVNGEDAVSGSWPWQVSLQFSGGHHCGGSLLNKNWVVTAAHCQVSAGAFRVVLGEYDLQSNSEPVQVKTISRVITHPNYNPNTFDNDIALVRLSSPVRMTQRISTVCLATSGRNIAPGTNCVTTGWGRTGQTPRPRFLQQSALPIVSPARCRQVWVNQITDSMVCAGASGVSSCSGDSGGPLVCQERGAWTLVGIVSWGQADCDVNTPVMYASVPFLRRWIDETMASN